MNGIKLQNRNEKTLVDSVDVAQEFKKKHKDVLESIDTFLHKNPEYEDEFVLSTYITSRGKTHRCYLLSDKAVDIMENKFKYNIRSARFEYKWLNELTDFLDEMNIKYLPQFLVDQYGVDLYLPNQNIAIEFDEYEHKFQEEEDKNRQEYIENKIGCKFLRIKEGTSCGTMIAMLVKELNQKL